MARHGRTVRVQERKARKVGNRRRRQVKEQSRRRRQRARTTTTSYRHGLQDAIANWFPGQFFSHWPVVAGSKWSPLRLFWMAILMVWSAEQTLQARFEATRDVVRSLFPKWPLGKSYTGWYEAQLKWMTPLRPALSKRLQQQIESMAGKHWQREGWCAFAVDGSRVECPRTAANERVLKCAGRKKTGPQLFLTTLLHMGTGLPWDFRIGPGTDSERRHLEDMLPSAEYVKRLKRVPKAWEKAFEVNAGDSDAMRASCVEFVLAGLYATDQISRGTRHGRITYET